MTWLWGLVWVVSTVYLMIGAIYAYLGYALGHAMSGNPRSAWYCLWFCIAWAPIGLMEKYKRKHTPPVSGRDLN